MLPGTRLRSRCRRKELTQTAASFTSNGDQSRIRAVPIAQFSGALSPVGNKASRIVRNLGPDVDTLDFERPRKSLTHFLDRAAMMSSPNFSKSPSILFEMLLGAGHCLVVSARLCVQKSLRKIWVRKGVAFGSKICSTRPLTSSVTRVVICPAALR